MAAFDLDADTTHPYDFPLVRDGGLALFLNDEILCAGEASLVSLGYELIHVDVADADEDAMHRKLAEALGFPDYYGLSTNALRDCLYDVAHGDYGWDPTGTGLAVSIRGVSHLARRDRELMVSLASSFGYATQIALLFGHRPVWLLHVDDPSFQLDLPIARTIPWNPNEWFDSARH